MLKHVRTNKKNFSSEKRSFKVSLWSGRKQFGKSQCKLFEQSWSKKTKSCISSQKKCSFEVFTTSVQKQFKLFGDHHSKSFEQNWINITKVWSFSEKKLSGNFFLSGKKTVWALSTKFLEENWCKTIKLLLFFEKISPQCAPYQVENSLNNSENINKSFSSKLGAKIQSFSFLRRTFFQSDLLIR